MEIHDTEIRQEILEIDGSLAISASAGSGKTTIMIKKIIKKLSEIENHKTVAAITFTIKATEEIRKKAEEMGNRNFVIMTNDSFIEHEIIRPFIKDVFEEINGQDFIISYQRADRFNSYCDGLNKLKTDKRLGTYWDNMKNFKFKLAKHILLKSVAAREYLKSKYSMLFLDEYQDSDQDMHNFFLYVKKELNIDLFMVGDSKQAIYLWRGAVPNVFELLKNEEIPVFELFTNFRSHFEIVNYANLIHNEPHFKKPEETATGKVLHCITETPEKYLDVLILQGRIDLNKSIAIIININEEAQNFTDALNEYGYDFLFVPRTPLDDGSENSRILISITKYVLDKYYSIYDLADVLRIPQHRQIINEVKEVLSPLKNIIPSQIGETVNVMRRIVDLAIDNLNLILGISITADEIDNFFQSLTNPSYYPAFIQSDDLHRVMTVFGAKGLEFDQVISFSKYYDLSNTNKRNNHYVCVTRAKELFIMLDGQGRNYGNYIDSCISRFGIIKKKNVYTELIHG